MINDIASETQKIHRGHLPLMQNGSGVSSNDRRNEISIYSGGDLFLKKKSVDQLPIARRLRISVVPREI